MDIHCSKYSLNIAQDPTYPSIWKYLSRNIFDHQRNSFLSNVPGGQNGKVYQCDSLVTLGELDLKFIKIRVIGAITVAIVQLIECFNKRLSIRLLLALKDSLLGSKIALSRILAQATSS